jgi:DNA-binding FadR family transcriptional regulator
VAGRSVGLLLQLRGTTLADIWAARLLIEPPLALLAGLLDEIFQLHATRVATDQSRNLDHAQLNKTTLRSHTKLVSLIEAGDAARAEAFWKRHLELSGTVMPGEHGSSTVVDLYSQNDPQQYHRLPH